MVRYLMKTKIMKIQNNHHLLILYLIQLLNFKLIIVTLKLIIKMIIKGLRSTPNSIFVINRRPQKLQNLQQKLGPNPVKINLKKDPLKNIIKLKINYKIKHHYYKQIKILLKNLKQNVNQLHQTQHQHKRSILSGLKYIMREKV